MEKQQTRRTKLAAEDKVLRRSERLYAFLTGWARTHMPERVRFRTRRGRTTRTA